MYILSDQISVHEMSLDDNHFNRSFVKNRIIISMFCVLFIQKLGSHSQLLEHGKFC